LPKVYEQNEQFTGKMNKSNAALNHYTGCLRIEGLFGILEEARDMREAGKDRDILVTIKSE